MGAWDDNDFPKADDPADVGYMLVQWRTTPCYSGCEPGEDYILNSRQFDHLGTSATRKEAVDKFNGYVARKKAAGKQPNHKSTVVFLAKVELMEIVSDAAGEIVND